jgi:prolyl oligopeptidase
MEMLRTNNLMLLVLVAGLTACNSSEKTEKMVYPETRKVDTTDVYFGQEVADPYRWLEDDLSAETEEWVENQNQLTFGYLEDIEFREDIRKRLEEVFNYERITAPEQYGDYYYYFRNDGLQNQDVLYRRKGIDGSEEVFLNPNEFSEDGTVSLAGISFSKDGSLVAYQISEGGSDWRKAIVMNAENKEVLEDTLVNIKFSGISWKGNEGFYYSSYDKPEEGSALSGKTQFHKLFYHRLGSSQKDDYLVFGGEKIPRRYIFAEVTEDQRFLVIQAAQSTSGNELYIQDLNQPGADIKAVVSDFDSENTVLANEGNRLLIYTNYQAPNYRIAEVDFNNLDRSDWKDVIPQTENMMEASTAGKKIFTRYLVDAKTQVKQFDYQGNFEREIELPAIGTTGSFAGKKEDETLYYTFTSFTYPSTIFKYDISSGKSELYRQPEVDFDPEAYETEQVFFNSKDGTRVPMFIVKKKGVELNGQNPTILYSYGGFNISLKPSFSTSLIVWLENGGIYAQPNIRGGGEYGEDWHLAGTKMNKQNVFDDFIAAGEYLIENNYTSSEFLALRGGSNGGLLVGATMTQRPDLAKVALPAVGVLDMLRYHKFTAGAGWAYDYGTSEDSPEMFDYLLAYSPLHNLEEGVEYPATLITTADHDDRVVPAHSFKFAAELQDKHAGENPVLIRIETNAGHGAGTPVSKIIEQYADIYAFTWYNMGVVPELAKKSM